MVGWRCPRWRLSRPFTECAPSVTPWYSFTRLPILQVSPTTTPVPWSMKKLWPIVAPGWMSMPVRLWTSSDIMRGSSGTRRLYR
jgi:hypothetical protein